MIRVPQSSANGTPTARLAATIVIAYKCLQEVHQSCTQFVITYKSTIIIVSTYNTAIRIVQ